MKLEKLTNKNKEIIKTHINNQLEGIGYGTINWNDLSLFEQNCNIINWFFKYLVIDKNRYYCKGSEWIKFENDKTIIGDDDLTITFSKRWLLKYMWRNELIWN